MSTATAHLKTASLGDRLIRRFSPLYDRYRRELLAFDRADIDGRKSLQERLIAHALTNASRLPGYDRLAGMPLSEWPDLRKEILQSGHGDYVNPRGFLATSAETSGSSGIPLG